MQKTKLGVSIAVVGAALYFFGLFNFVAAVVLAGYVLIVEENEWLKRVAVKMLILVITFMLLGVAVNFINEIFNVIYYVAGWFMEYPDIYVPANLDSILRNLINLAETVLFVVLGFNALKMGTVKIGFADKMINKYM